MPNPYYTVRNQDTYDVKSVGKRLIAVPVDPDLGRFCQLPPLSVVDRIYWRSEGLAATRFDLNESDLVITPHDEIDITMSTAKAMGDDGPSFAQQPSGGDAFALQAKCLSLFRHVEHDKCVFGKCITAVMHRWS